MDVSPLRIGALTTFATLGFAAVVGLVAVFDADNVASGFGRGFGIGLLVFLAGATLACALACLGRRRAERLSVGSIVVTGVALDLLVVAICFEIDDETYGKIAGIAFIWSLFALIGLGLTLAVALLGSLTRILYGGAIGATVLSALVSTWLIATAGRNEVEEPSNSLVPYFDLGDDELLRILGASLVVLATLWFSTLAASRLASVKTSI